MLVSQDQENDHTADRDDGEDCHGSTDALDLPVTEKTVIPFPHEHHWSLTQEWLAVFGGASMVTLIDMVPGSGAKLLGCLLSNGRGIGVARSQQHVKWMMENLISWVRQKRLVTVTGLSKPEALIAWERQMATSRQGNQPTPRPAPPTPATPVTPATPATSSEPPPQTLPPVRPTGLLEAFGRAAQ